MLHKIIVFSLTVFGAGVLMMPLDAMSDATDQDPAHLKAGRKKVEGVVTGIKSGIYTVKTQSSTYTLSENASIRDGHGAPKVGDDMILWVSENNLVIDAHPKEHDTPRCIALFPANSSIWTMLSPRLSYRHHRAKLL